MRMVKFVDDKSFISIATRLAILLLIAPAASIRCMVCVNCDEVGLPQECGENVTQCVTITVEDFITKDCGKGSVDPVCTEEEMFGFVTATCFCDGDLCNGLQSKTKLQDNSSRGLSSKRVVTWASVLLFMKVVWCQ